MHTGGSHDQESDSEYDTRISDTRKVVELPRFWGAEKRDLLSSDQEDSTDKTQPTNTKTASKYHGVPHQQG